MEENNNTPQNNNSQMVAALSYLPVVSFVIYFLKKDQKDIYKNAKQGVALSIVFLISWLFAVINLFWLGFLWGIIVFVSFGLSVAGFVVVSQGSSIMNIPFLTKYLQDRSLTDVYNQIKQTAKDTKDHLSQNATPNNTNAPAQTPRDTDNSQG